MVKRTKRLKKGIESLKEEIEKHFAKIEEDIGQGRKERGGYHVKEIDNGLLNALKIKMDILNIEDNSIQEYKERLEKLKKKLKDN